MPNEFYKLFLTDDTCMSISGFHDMFSFMKPCHKIVIALDQGFYFAEFCGTNEHDSSTFYI